VGSLIAQIEVLRPPRASWRIHLAARRLREKSTIEKELPTS